MGEGPSQNRKAKKSPFHFETGFEIGLEPGGLFVEDIAEAYLNSIYVRRVCRPNIRIGN